MSLYYVERQPWQRWPKKLIMAKKVDGGEKDERRAYVLERTCTPIRRGTIISCGACGSELHEPFRFCGGCGAKVVGE